MSVEQLPPDETQVDERAALEALDGSRELLEDLAQMFCEDAPVVLNELNAALEVEDAASARRAAHSLKGLAATFFAQPTIELAQRLEQEAASGRLEPLKACGAEQLEKAVQRLIVELKGRGLAG